MGQALGGGEEQDPFDVVGPALGGRVEGPHGVHLVPEEVNTHRLFHAGGKHVGDAAPHGKLAHALHLVAAGIPGGGEEVCQCVEGAALAGGQLQTGPLQGGGVQGTLEEAFHGRHQEGHALPLEAGEQGQPPLLPLVGDGHAAVEVEGPGAQDGGGLPGEGGQILGQPCGLPFVGAHQHHGEPGFPAQGGGQTGPVDGGQAGQGGGTAAAVDYGQQLLQQGALGQRLEQRFHGGLLLSNMIWI